VAGADAHMVRRARYRTRRRTEQQSPISVVQQVMAASAIPARTRLALIVPQQAKPQRRDPVAEQPAREPDGQALPGMFDDHGWPARRHHGHSGVLPTVHAGRLVPGRPAARPQYASVVEITSSLVTVPSSPVTSRTCRKPRRRHMARLGVLSAPTMP